MPQRIPGAHNICTPAGAYNTAPPELIHRLSAALKKWDGEIVAAVGTTEAVALFWEAIGKR